MDTVQFILVVAAAIWVPLSLVSYGLTIHTVRELQPEILEAIDSEGYKTWDGSSQLKFARFILSRRFRGVAKGKVATMCEFRFFISLGYYAVLLAILATFFI